MALYSISIWDREDNSQGNRDIGGEVVLYREFEADSDLEAVFRAGEINAAEAIPVREGRVIIRRGLAGTIADVNFTVARLPLKNFDGVLMST